MMCGCLGRGRKAREAAVVAVAGDRSIIWTAHFVIMIAMLMMALLLQLKVLNCCSCCRRSDPISQWRGTVQLCLTQRHQRIICETPIGLSFSSTFLKTIMMDYSPRQLCKKTKIKYTKNRWKVNFMLHMYRNSALRNIPLKVHFNVEFPF